MSVGLYMDVHVPAAVTRGLLLRGVDVLTAQLDGTTELEDPALLDRATQLGRVLFSQDEDLLAEAANASAERRAIQRRHLRPPTRDDHGRAVNDLEILAQAGTSEDFANRVEYLPL